ncbi:hypothetical protein XPA_010096 [Xanthoria parietina]
MRASLTLLAAFLACASAWHVPISNQTISASSSVIPHPTGGISHPTGEPQPHNPIPPPGTGIQPPQTTKYPTGTGGPLPPTTVSVPLTITKTIYGPGTATITQTFVGTTSIVSTVTQFVPCSTPVATAGSSTYFSTSLTTLLSLTTITAETTSYVVFCPTPTPESGSHPVAESPSCPSCPILGSSACQLAATITQTIYLPAPSAPAGHGAGSGNGIANGNGKGSDSAPGSNSGSNGPQHPPMFPPGPYHPTPPAPYPSGNGTQLAHPTGTGRVPIVTGTGNKPTATGGSRIHY